MRLSLVLFYMVGYARFFNPGEAGPLRIYIWKENDHERSGCG